MSSLIEALRSYGIGLLYYGKKNYRLENGTCPHCGYTGMLATFDSGHYFSVLTVPLFPLSPKHISNECPKCKKSDSMHYKRFAKRKSELVSEVRSELKKDFPDDTSFLQALHEFKAFQDPAPLGSVALEFVEACKNKYAILSALREAFVYYGTYEYALLCAKHCYDLRKGPRQRLTLVEMLLYNRQPKEAEELLGDEVWDVEENARELVPFLIEVYCDIGSYVDAYRVYKEHIAIQSTLLDDERFRKLHELIDMGIATEKPIISQRIITNSKPFKEHVRVTRKTLVKYFCIIFIPLLLLYSFIASFLKYIPQKMYVANGTSMPYEVSIHGERFTLKPFSLQTISLAEGTYEITTSLKGVKSKQQLDLHKNFWLRPISSQTVVINPDHCALLYEIDVEYGKRASTDWNYRYRTLGLSHRFKCADYTFQTIPDTIMTDSEFGVTTKTGLKMIREFDGYSPVLTAAKVLSPDSASQFLKEYVALVPTDKLALNYYVNTFGEDALEFLTSVLDDEPVNVHAHMLYQDLFLRYGAQRNLVTEYTERLLSDSVNSNKQYLLGRVQGDSTRIVLYKKAINSHSPSPHALCALAKYEYCNEDFLKGRELAFRAYKLESDNEEFEEVYQLHLHICKDFNTLIESIKQSEKRDPYDLAYRLYEFEILYLLDQKNQAEARMGSYLSKLEQEGYGNIENYRNSFDIHRAIINGDRNLLKKYYAKSEYYSFYTGLLNGDFKKCEASLISWNSDSYEKSFLAYIIAKEKDLSRESNNYFKKAVDQLEEFGDEYASFISLLKSDEGTSNVTGDFKSSYTDKALFYTVLGMKYPQKREAFFKKARKYNYRVSLQKSILDVVL